MTVYNWSQLSIEAVTSLYLYGSLTKPDLLNDALIRQKVVKNTDDIYVFEDGTPLPTVTVDEVSFMTTGPGRFAKASGSALVKSFFTNNSLFNTTGVRQEFSLTEVLGKLEFTKIAQYSIVIQQLQYEAGSNDFLQRSVIYDMSSFTITDKYLPADKKTKFIIEANGTKHIQNMQILALDDNFDFITDAGDTTYANSFLQPSIDPSNIGRRINFKFDDTSKAKVPIIADYSSTHYDAEKTAGPIDYTAGVGRLIYLKNGLIDELWKLGVIKFLDSLSRPIIYGTNGGDILDAVNLKWETMYPKLAPL